MACLRIRKIFGAFILVWTILLFPTSSACAEQIGFEQWVNDRIAKEVAVAVSSRSNANQTEAPSTSANATTLVDTSSASDLIGVALNLAGLTAGSKDGNNSGDATSTAATVSAYAVYAAARGVDPLKPGFYCEKGPLGGSALWRRLSFTLGFEDQKGDNNSIAQNNPILVGTKLVVWTERDVCSADFSAVQKAMAEATQAASVLFMKGEDELYEMYKSNRFPTLPSGLKKHEFINELNQPNSFDTILKALGNDPFAILFSKGDIGAFVNLDNITRQQIQRFQQKPQLSIGVFTKQREKDGADEYRIEALFDFGLNDRLVLTANGSYDYNNGETTGHTNGGRIAVALQFQPFHDPLFGPKPLRFSLSGEGKWMERMGPIYRAQIKMNLPIPRIESLAGFEIPISLTVANRSDLINEKEVRGTIGFTMDTSQVLANLRRQL